MHNYEGPRGVPPAETPSREWCPPARLLAYVEQDNLQKLVNFHAPWPTLRTS